MTAHPLAWSSPRLLTGLFFLALVLVAAPRGLTDEVTTGEDEIIINETFYHGPDDDPADDWIELYNRGTENVDLSGWQFTDGVHFVFLEGTVLAPDSYLVVAADPASVLAEYPGISVVGPWEGTLSNGGDRLRLLNRDGTNEIEEFRYDDDDPWPMRADGDGYSLERRNPRFDNDTAANWAASEAKGWVRLSVVGVASSPRLLLYLDGPGEAVVDEFSLKAEGSDTNLLPNPGFEEDLTGNWTPKGNHAGSQVVSDMVHGGSKALKIISTGVGNGTTNGVSIEDSGAVKGSRYSLECHARLLSGTSALVVKMSGTTSTTKEGMYIVFNGAFPTPGAKNATYAEDIPPFIYPVAHDPQRPLATDTIRVFATVADDKGVAGVTLHFDPGTGEETVPLTDDGTGADFLAGDGVFAGTLGQYALNAIVRYWVTATDSAGQEGRYPASGNTPEVRGAFIEPPIDTDLPVYHILMTQQALTALNSNPNSDAYQPATFIHDGVVYFGAGARYRGQTSRGWSKHQWKVDFPGKQKLLPAPGYPKVGNINLNSLWSDKTYMREMLCFNLWKDMGEPSLDTWHVRMYLNGAYYGLYVCVENPNADFLERNGMSPTDWLWKSQSEAKSGSGGFEQEAGSTAGTQALADFVNKMNTLQGAALDGYIQDNMNVESFINFLAATQLVHNADHPAKNYLVYASSTNPAGTWTYLPWDMDLTHGRNFECASTTTGQAGILFGDGTGVLNDTIRFDMWDAQYGDTKLLFGTSPHPKCDGPWNGVIHGFLVRTTSFRDAYYERTREALETFYHSDVLVPKMRKIRDRLRGLGEFSGRPNEAALDRAKWSPFGGDGDFDRNYAFLESWVSKRFNHLAQKLAVLGHPIEKFIVADFSATGTTGKAPLTVTFTDRSPGEITSWLWEFGDGATSTERSPQHIYTTPGRYDVGLTVKASSGATGRELKASFVTVNDDLVLAFRAEPTTGVAPLEVQFYNESTGYAAKFQWNFGDRGTSEERDPKHTYAAAGTYTVRLIGTGALRSFTLRRDSYIVVLESGTPFIRGDTNRDGAVELTDAIVILNHLFRGEAVTTCLVALDVDDSDLIDLTDAIYLLRHLFQGGDPVPAPFPEPGADPTPGSLTCP